MNTRNKKNSPMTRAEKYSLIYDNLEKLNLCTCVVLINGAKSIGVEQSDLDAFVEQVWRAIYYGENAERYLRDTPRQE